MKVNQHTRDFSDDEIRNDRVYEAMCHAEKLFLDSGHLIREIATRIEDENGESVVVDFKSGKSRLAKKNIPLDIQLNIYAMALKVLNGKYPKRVSLLYLEEDGGKQVDYCPTEESIRVFREKLTGLVQGIMEERFDPSPEFMRCKFCDYGGLCPGKEKGEEGEIVNIVG